jgi:uncharacterized protein (TIGR00369 family)
MTATMMGKIPLPPCSQLMGWHLIEADRQHSRVRIGFEGRPEFCNPGDNIQGGLLSAMLDDAMANAVLLHTDGAVYAATISMNVNFLSPAKVGRLVADAWVVQAGKTVAFAEAKLTDAAGVAIATATSTARLIDAAKAIRPAAQT